MNIPKPEKEQTALRCHSFSKFETQKNKNNRNNFPAGNHKKSVVQKKTELTG